MKVLQQLKYPTVVLGLCLLMFFTGCSDQPGPVGPDQDLQEFSQLPAKQSPSVVAGGPAPTMSAARFEIRFMQNMIDHHMMAIMMSSVCTTKTVHPELDSLCHAIITAQMMEMEEMQMWLQDWYGITYEPEIMPGDMQMMDRLASLSGEEFEVMFMEMMIRHHSKAVREGLHCIDRAYHAELIELCQNMVASQTEEIQLMAGWLCKWYDICKYEDLTM